MKYKVFCIHDSKVDAYAQPFIMRTRGEAIRGFTGELSNQKSMISKHPGDYSLMEIAEYDDQTGRYSQYDTLVCLGTGLDHQVEKQSEISTISR